MYIIYLQVTNQNIGLEPVVIEGPTFPLIFLQYVMVIYLYKFTVDDGTAVVSCTQWRVEKDSDQGIVIPELGQLVSVWGKISEFRREKQLTVTTMVQQKDPNAEPLHWLEVVHLKKTVYSRPFTLPDGILKSEEIFTGESELSARHALQCTMTSFLIDQCSDKHFILKDLAVDSDLLKACRERRELADWTEEELKTQINSLAQGLPAMGIVIPALGVGIQKPETLKYEVRNSHNYDKV